MPGTRIAASGSMRHSVSEILTGRGTDMFDWRI
jgi:hypothetical protein